MNSSISSSELQPVSADLRRTERKVLLALAVLLVALELFTRTRLFQASKDFRRFGHYPERASELVAAPGVRLAFIGNSATDRGVDPHLVAKSMSSLLDKPVEGELFAADQSRINTWHFIAEHTFFSAGKRPDALVLTFYEDDLTDGNPIEIGRVAQFFTSVRDWPTVFATDLKDLGNRTEFVLSSFWATYAASDRVRERILRVAVPNYEAFAAAVNDALYHHLRLRTAPELGPAKSPAHRALLRFLARAHDANQPVIIVAYPTLTSQGREPYELAPLTQKILEEAKVPFVDLRRVPRLTPNLYADEVHLTEEGREVYSPLLGEALAPLFATGGPAPPQTLP